MYSIKRVSGKYLAINDKDRSEVYIVPDDVFVDMVRKDINRNSISDGVFLSIKQSKAGIVPYKAFDKFNRDELKESEKMLRTSHDKQETLKRKRVRDGKINLDRNKSKKLKAIEIRMAAAGIALIMAWSGIGVLKKKLAKDTDKGYTIEHSIDDDKDVVNEDNFDNDYENIFEDDQDWVEDEKDYDEDGVLDFDFEEWDISDESANNATQYIDLCKKYGNMYGEDYRMLMGTLAQELNGKHKLELDTSAIGVSQIEKIVWVNTKIKAYNFENKDYDEYWLIAPNAEDTIDDEEFKKRPKSDDIIEKYGKDNVINIETVEGSIKARAMIDAYNAESAYKNGALDSISKNDFPAYSKARENKGQIVYKTLAFGDDWKNHLDITNNGDDNFYRKVYSYAVNYCDYFKDNNPFKTMVFDGEKVVNFMIRANAMRKYSKNK